MESIYSLTYEKAKALILEYNLSENSVKNIFSDIYKSGAKSYDEMAVTSQKVKAVLNKHYKFDSLETAEILKSETTAKYLFRLSDGNYIETVLMRQTHGNAVCISTQCGCNMGCAFCSSGKLKKIRNLSTAELILQVLEIQRNENIKINNITVMGIGEPLDNMEALCDFLKIATDDNCLAIGKRHITVSTCGVVPKIKKLAQFSHCSSLAISLHSADNEKRNMLMPINKKYPLEELIPALKFFSREQGKKIFAEYILLSGVNDGIEDADKLASLLEGLDTTVNLIMYNESDCDFRRCSKETALSFYDRLKKRGISVTLRKEFGGNLKAACGQLRSDRMKYGGNNEI